MGTKGKNRELVFQTNISLILLKKRFAIEKDTFFLLAPNIKIHDDRKIS